MNMFTFDQKYGSDIVKVYHDDIDGNEINFDIEITRFLVVKGSHSYNAPSDLDFYGYEELEFDGGGHLSGNDYTKLHDELIIYLLENRD